MRLRNIRIAKYYPRSGSYDFRYKSIAVGATDVVKVDFGSYPEKDSVVFKDRFGGPIKLNSRTNTLTFTAPQTADANYIYAYDKTGERIGKLMVKTYAVTTYDVSRYDLRNFLNADKTITFIAPSDLPITIKPVFLAGSVLSMAPTYVPTKFIEGVFWEIVDKTLVNLTEFLQDSVINKNYDWNKFDVKYIIQYDKADYYADLMLAGVMNCIPGGKVWAKVSLGCIKGVDIGVYLSDDYEQVSLRKSTYNKVWKTVMECSLQGTASLANFGSDIWEKFAERYYNWLINFTTDMFGRVIIND